MTFVQTALFFITCLLWLAAIICAGLGIHLIRKNPDKTVGEIAPQLNRLNGLTAVCAICAAVLSMICAILGGQ